MSYKNRKRNYRYLPVSIGGVFAFDRNVHKQNISTDMIAMKIMPIAIPRIRNKFECLPLFGELDDDVEVGEWCKGVFTGDAANVGAET